MWTSHVRCIVPPFDVPEPNPEQGWSHLPKPNTKRDHPILKIRDETIPSHFVPDQTHGYWLISFGKRLMVGLLLAHRRLLTLSVLADRHNL
jgi:hypothetical protein